MKRLLTLFAALALSVPTAGMAGPPGASSSSAAPPRVPFQVQFPTQFVGDQWYLEVHGSSDPKLTRLASGVVPVGGLVSSDASRSAIAASAGFVMLTSTHIKLGGRADAAFTTVGIEPDTATGLAALDFPAPVIADIPTFAGSGWTMPPASGFGSASVVSGPSAPTPQTFVAADWCTVDGTPCSSQVSLATPDCAPFTVLTSGESCVLERELAGADALRAISQRVEATTSTQAIESGAVQIWENGVRYGPTSYAYAGKTNRNSVEDSIEDVWAARGDCMEGVPDIGACDGGTGHKNHYGTDSWTRELIATYHQAPLAPYGVFTYREQVMNTAFNGGQQVANVLLPARIAGFYFKTSEIRASVHGNHAIYSSYGGSRIQRHQTSNTISSGATIGFSSSVFGSGSWTSSMTHDRYNKVKQTWFHRNATQASSWLHSWYYYDRSVSGLPWPQVFMSCRKQPGVPESGNNGCRAYDA